MDVTFAGSRYVESSEGFGVKSENKGDIKLPQIKDFMIIPALQ